MDEVPAPSRQSPGAATEAPRRSPRLAPQFSQLADVIDQLAGELRGEAHVRGRIRLDTQFERDLGFDSLARAELLTRIEQTFNTPLPVETFASALTPADVLRALQAMTAVTATTAAPNVATQATPAEPHIVAVAPATPQITPAKPALDEPADALTLTAALAWHAGRHPERTHLIVLEDGLTETPLTYGELDRRARDMAGGLRALGVDPGDTVALMLATGCDYFVSFMAVLMCGAIPVPVYPPASLAQIEEHVQRHAAILVNAQVKVLIAFEEVATVARLLRIRVATLQHVVTPAQIVPRPFEAPAAASPDDIALLQYTSGSTGDPKGVVLTHANLLANLRAMGTRMRVDADDVLVSWLPLYHDMGLIGAWMAPLYYGLPFIVTSPLTFLARPQRWLAMIARYRGTITAAPNFAYERCAHQLPERDLEGLDLSSLRYAFCGAEPVSPATMRAFAERLAPFGLRETTITPVYGLAENTLGLTFPQPGRGLSVDRIEREPLNARGIAVPSRFADANALELVSCGTVLDGTALRIVGDDGLELPERRVGRIEFRGTSATRGYYRNPAQTARLIRDGWLDTGDLGYLAHAELFITGRVKDMIIRGGRHFFPYELEDAIGRLPGVVPGGVAVCGSTDTHSGTERVVIVVETAAPSPADTATGTDHAALQARINAAAIALYGAPPEEIGFVAPHSILKTPGGKIRHAATLECYERHGKRLPEHRVWRQLADIAAASLAPLWRRAVQRVARTGRGLYCWIAFALLAPPVWFAIAFSRNVPRNWRIASGACRLYLRVAGLDVSVKVNAEVSADVNIKGKPETELHAGGAKTTAVRPILAANHASYLDAVVLLAVLPAVLPPPVNFVAKREFATRPFAGRLLRALGTCFVERTDYRRSLEDEAKLVESATAPGHDALLFFPEGTFTRAAGLREFHLGAFRAACLAQRPVVPVALNGMRAAMRDGEWIPRAGSVTVTVMPPIWPEGRDFAAMTQLRDSTRAAILLHCGEPALAVGAPQTPPAV